MADDQNAIVQLRAALWAAGFTAEGVSAAMGTSGEGFTPRPSQVPVLLRMLAEGTARSTLVKLFLAGVPVPAAEASAALHPLEIDAAVALGLVRVVDGQVSAQVRLAPSGDLLRTRTVRQAIDESVGLLADDVDRAGVEHRTVGIVTRMLELGFVHPAPNA